MAPPAIPTKSPTLPLIELIDVGKTYPGGSCALAGLSLAVAPGEFLSIVGPSGCGKSTALRLIAGLSAPSSGEIRWGNSVDRKHDISFVFQDPTLPPWSRVARNVALPLELRGTGRNEVRERVAEALELVGLSDVAGSYPRQLSGGMKMRVAIARAIVTRPKVLLMDEPFAALDEITRSRLNDDLLRLWERGGWTVLFVTHSVYESVYLSQRVVTMGARPGKIVAEAATAAPYPRDEAFRLTGAYADACAAVSRSLQGAVAAAAGQPPGGG